MEGDPSEEQQRVLAALEDRVNQAIELYGEDGALVRVNGRSVCVFVCVYIGMIVEKQYIQTMFS